MRKAKTPSRNSKKSKEDPSDYHRRIQNYKQDIDKIKTQVSQLQQKLDEQTDYDSTIELTDDFLQDKFPTKKSKDVKGSQREQNNVRKGKEAQKKNQNQNDIPDNEEVTKVNANEKTKNSQPRQKSPSTSTDHHKRKQSADRRIDIETPSIENYNQILTDNKVLAHKIKNLLVSNSNLDEENKSLKVVNDDLNQKAQELHEQLASAKLKLAKLEKANKELKASKNMPNGISKKGTSSRSKSVNKMPVMIDPDQIKEKVNSREVDIDKLLSLEDDASTLNKRNEELKKSIEKNNILEKENKKLKEKANNLAKEYQKKIDSLTTENKELKKQLENSPKQLTETPSTKKLRIADSETIADLTDKIALLEEENMKLRSKTLSATSVNIENQDLKKQLNKKQRSRPIDSEAIADLTEKISDLNQENMSLKKLLISCQSLRSENEDLKDQIEKLKNKNPKELKATSNLNLDDNASPRELREKVLSLSKENSELKSTTVAYKSLEREHSKLQDKYNSLIEAIQRTKPDQSAKKQIEKLKSTIEALSKENNDLKSNVSSSDLKARSNKINGNDNENEIKRLSEELLASKAAIDQMEKEFSLQKKELKDNYDSLLNEIINDIQNKPNPKEDQYNKKVKSLEQELNDQKLLYNSIKNVNMKLQDQIAQSRANNLVLIKQIEDMNKQIEHLTNNTSSIQSDDTRSHDHIEQYKERDIKNYEYDQIKKDFVQIHKALADVPDSSDSYSSKFNQQRLENHVKTPPISPSKLNPNEKSDSKKSSDSPNQTLLKNKAKNTPITNSKSPKKEANQDSSNNKSLHPYQVLNNNDDDDEIDNFLNENKIDILSDNDNDTENDDINEFLNDNFTDSDNDKDENIQENKNEALSDNDNKKGALNKNNKRINMQKNKSADSSIDIDTLLNTSGNDLDGCSTSEAFRQLVDSLGQNKGEFSLNTDEEYEKLKATLSLEDTPSAEENTNNKDKSPKRNKKNEYMMLDEDADDKSFSS